MYLDKHGIGYSSMHIMTSRGTTDIHSHRGAAARALASELRVCFNAVVEAHRFQSHKRLSVYKSLFISSRHSIYTNKNQYY